LIYAARVLQLDNPDEQAAQVRRELTSRQQQIDSGGFKMVGVAAIRCPGYVIYNTTNILHATLLYYISYTLQHNMLYNTCVYVQHTQCLLLYTETQ